jgi:hypothetical protein
VQGVQISLYLVFLPPQSGMKTARYKVESLECPPVHVDRSRGRQVQLEGTENAHVFDQFIDLRDFLRLLF